MKGEYRSSCCYGQKPENCSNTIAELGQASRLRRGSKGGGVAPLLSQISRGCGGLPPLSNCCGVKLGENS